MRYPETYHGAGQGCDACVALDGRQRRDTRATANFLRALAGS